MRGDEITLYRVRTLIRSKTCGFPQKWMSADGLTLWSIFSVYGAGAKLGINAHDKFNLVKATLAAVRQKGF